MLRSKFFTFCSALLLTAQAANAATTVQFYEPFFGGIVDNLANAAGVASVNMRWGIVVDTSGNGFAGSGTGYDGYVSPATTSGFWGFGGAASDDYYIAGELTVNGADFYPGGDFGGSTPGFGSIIDDIVVSHSNGISAGDSFALVWFDANSTAEGAKYGFFTHASFVLPTDVVSTVVSYGTPFQGTDPIRAASNTFAGAAVVPEPSRAFLLLGGVLGLGMKRRRRA